MSNVAVMGQDRIGDEARSREMPSDAAGTVGGPVAPSSLETPKPDITLYKRGELSIRSAEEFTAVSSGLQVNKGFQKRVKEFFAPMKKAANDAHAAVCKRENETLAPAIEDEKVRKDALEAFDREQRRIAAEEQRRREVEERERQKVREREETDRRLAEAAALEQVANETGEESLRAEAHAIVSAPIEVPQTTVIVKPALPEVKGLSFSDKWEVLCDEKGLPLQVNVKELCAAIGRGDVPESYIKVNVGAIDKVFQATKGAMKIPGVPCHHRRVPSSTAK